MWCAVTFTRAQGPRVIWVCINVRIVEYSKRGNYLSVAIDLVDTDEHNGGVELSLNTSKGAHERARGKDTNR